MQDKLVQALKYLFQLATKYTVAIVIIVVGAIFGFAILRIQAVATGERDDEYFDEKRTEIKIIKFDEATIERIKELRELDINVTSDFVDDRNNPFED